MGENILNLESLKMRDELEQQKREAAKQAVLSNIETIKKFGIILTAEQVQELLQRAMEQQETEE